MDKARDEKEYRGVTLDLIPPGFVPHARKSGLTAPWEPIYAKTTDTAFLLGLRAGPAHANSRGIVHGGLLTALADNAMGLSCGLRLDGNLRLLTVSLTVDFLASARLGQWIEVDTTFVKAGKRLCFAQAFVRADGEPCARTSATFSVVAPETAS